LTITALYKSRILTYTQTYNHAYDGGTSDNNKWLLTCVIVTLYTINTVMSPKPVPKRR